VAYFFVHPVHAVLKKTRSDNSFKSQRMCNVFESEILNKSYENFFRHTLNT